MQLTRENLHGIYAGLPTPWDDAGRLDTQTFMANVERVIALGADGVYTSDTTGEFYALTFDEFTQLVDALAEATSDQAVGTMAGCTALNTADVIRRMEYAASCGIGGVHVAFPFWGALTDREAEMFMAELARGCPDIAIVHYNLTRARRVLTGHHYRRLIEVCPTLIGTKFTSSDLYPWCELVNGVPELTHFCGDFFFLSGLMFGARGMYSSMIYTFPRAMRRIYDLARESRWDAALPLQRALNAFFVEAIEPLLDAGYIDGALDKAIAEAAGLIKGSRSMRPPYEGVSDEHMVHLQRVVDKYRPQLES